MPLTVRVSRTGKVHRAHTKPSPRRVCSASGKRILRAGARPAIDYLKRGNIVEILVCRVAWMQYYQSDKESAVGGGSYVDGGHVPHESLNFLPVGKTYYGYVRVVSGGQLGIQPPYSLS